MTRKKVDQMKKSTCNDIESLVGAIIERRAGSKFQRELIMLDVLSNLKIIKKFLCAIDGRKV